MSILIDKNTRLVVQGITGRDGSFHSSQMIAYGTNEDVARKILSDAGLSATTSMDDGVRTVIAKAQEVTV